MEKHHADKQEGHGVILFMKLLIRPIKSIVLQQLPKLVHKLFHKLFHNLFNNLFNNHKEAQL